MKRTLRALAGLAVLCLLASAGGAADKAGEHGDGHVILPADKLQWGENPVLPPGAKVAVIHGNPGKAGDLYAVRAKLPDGYKVPPHWHPTDENVTVLQGTMLFGIGEHLDPAKTTVAPAGAFARMPAGVRHFAIAKGDTIIQVHGIGPFDFTYVNPADDPRKK
jgi:quercetin dioxygenase-like cupin family protein